MMKGGGKELGRELGRDDEREGGKDEGIGECKRILTLVILLF